MQAEIIVIGDEILIGQTLDTNSQMIAVELNKRGIQVHQKRVIADERKPILEALEQVHPDTQLVFLTGGLGPTRDDIRSPGKGALCGL
jgi:nicotinamide-nucleotide amidase